MISRASESSSRDDARFRLTLLDRSGSSDDIKRGGLAPISSLATNSPTPELLATPTATTFSTKMDFQSPMPHARLASPSMLGKRSMPSPPLAMPIACNFEALSHHFHLPLKVAAEKFGVRATAFKKRCRAIGIRHWPYRKVRSLKRSLQELGRCKDQGILNDKQHHQYLVFQGQLDKLLSPETYGIDPSGRLPPGAFDDVDDNDQDSNGDDCDDDDVSCTSNQSPRVDAITHFSDFKITSLRTKRSKKQKVGPKPVSTSLKRDFALPSGIITTPQHPHPYYFPLNDGPDTPQSRSYSLNGDLPSVSVRFASHSNHSSQGLPGFDSYDPFFQDFKSEFTLTMEDFGGDDQTQGGYAIDSGNQDDFFPFIRSPTMAAIRSGGASSSSTLRGSGIPALSPHAPSRSPAESSDNADDDVFLQISPDYGCLV